MMFRIDPQFSLGFEDLIVDNFAGGGGASTGIEAALGRPVDIAINHDPGAIAMHTVNHPQTHHYCESVWDVDPVEVCGGRPVGLAWFSPDCKHFSKAKGGKPVEKKIRGLAWIVLRWAAKVRPRVIMLENVEEFQTWGPLVNNRPCPARKGETFRRWIEQLEALGYQVEYRELRACDYGAPTIRKRLFVIARCDGEPIVWPVATHGPGLSPYKTAADIIDWSIPVQSIFERKRPLAENTMRRIAKGIQRFVIDHPDPFIISYYGSKSADDFRGQKLSKPIPTQTTENRFGLVVPFLTEHANGSQQRNMPIDEPLRTQCAQVKGGHFALVAPFLAQHNLGAVGRYAGDPLATITARGTQTQLVTANMVRDFGQSVGSPMTMPIGTVTPGGLGKTKLITSHMVKLRGTCKDGQDVRAPMPTVTAGGFHVGEVRAFLLKYYGRSVGHDCRDSLHTISGRDTFGLVTIKEEYQIVDIGMRMLSPRELFRAQGFDDSYIIDRDATGKPITKTEQVNRCGNSVCPPIAEALVRANVVEREAVEVA